MCCLISTNFYLSIIQFQKLVQLAQSINFPNKQQLAQLHGKQGQSKRKLVKVSTEYHSTKQTTCTGCAAPPSRINHTHNPQMATLKLIKVPTDKRTEFITILVVNVENSNQYLFNLTSNNDSKQLNAVFKPNYCNKISFTSKTTEATSPVYPINCLQA